MDKRVYRLVRITNVTVHYLLTKLLQGTYIVLHMHFLITS